jgi:hypothetical protein
MIESPVPGTDDSAVPSAWHRLSPQCLAPMIRQSPVPGTEGTDHLVSEVGPFFVSFFHAFDQTCHSSR